jgi:succinate dehydrogenase / fumarate reductase membrane anchor subunit
MAHNKDSIRTPLGAAKGLGSAREGTHHWWMQRVTSIALVPLSLFWLTCADKVTSGDYAAFTSWIASPTVAIAAILFVMFSFYHAVLGLQVIIEDYAQSEGWKITLLLLNKLVFFALGIACIFAIASLSFMPHGI